MEALMTVKENTEMYTLQLPSRQDSINQLETFVENLRSNYEIGDDAFGRILVAVTEAVNNAILHGNQQQESKKVYVNLEVQNRNRLYFTVADEGNGFDFNSVPDPTLPENLEKPCGRGVFIMRNYCDQFIYNSKGNEVEMMFKL